MDLAAFAPLIGYAFQKGKLGEVLTDVEVVLKDISITGGKLTPASIDALDKAGVANASLDALASVVGMVSDMIRTPSSHADGIAVLKALAGAT